MSSPSSLSSPSYRIKEGSIGSDEPGSHPRVITCIREPENGGTYRVDLVTNRYDTVGSIKSFIYENYQLFGYNQPPSSITIHSHDGLEGNKKLLEDNSDITGNLNIIIS